MYLKLHWIIKISLKRIFCCHTNAFASIIYFDKVGFVSTKIHTCRKMRRPKYASGLILCIYRVTFMVLFNHWARGSLLLTHISSFRLGNTCYRCKRRDIFSVIALIRFTIGWFIYLLTYIYIIIEKKIETLRLFCPYWQNGFLAQCNFGG